MKFSRPYALKRHIINTCKATKSDSVNRSEEAQTTYHPAEIPEFSDTESEVGSVDYPVVPSAHMPAHVEMVALYVDDIPGSPEHSANPVLVDLFGI